MFKKLAVAATLAVMASSASAVERGHIYAGADFGTTDFTDVAGRSSSFGSFVGYQFTRNLAVEANVRRLVDTTESYTDLRIVQTGISAVGTYPINSSVALFARAGYNRLNAKASNGFSETQNRFMYGAGASFAITPNIAARVEYQKPSSDSDNIGASVVFQF